VINSFLTYKIKNKKDQDLSLEDIQKAEKVLFSLFTRYGDTIIDLVVIKEFVEKYPTKDYLILCPKQMKPYSDEFLPKIKCIGINKRNYLDMIKLNFYLKKWSPDIGFNPWSFGVESSFFLSYCKIFQFYRNFNKPQSVNHYDVVRKYFRLPKKIWKIKNQIMDLEFKKVLICPESTDNERSISIDQIAKIIDDFKLNIDDSILTIASINSKYHHSNCNNFYFKKTEKSSRNFIILVQESDLIISADSAPLHVAHALNKNVMAVFNSTSPELVINSGSKVTFYTQ